MVVVLWLALAGCDRADSGPWTIETDRPARPEPIDTAQAVVDVGDEDTIDRPDPCDPLPRPPEPWSGLELATGDSVPVRIYVGTRFALDEGQVVPYAAGALGRQPSILVDVRDATGRFCTIGLGLDAAVPWLLPDAAAVSTTDDDDAAVSRWLAERELAGGFVLRPSAAVRQVTDCALAASVPWASDPWTAWLGGVTPGAWYIGLGTDLLQTDATALTAGGVRWPPLEGWTSGLVRLPAGVPGAPLGGELPLAVASYELDDCMLAVPGGDNFAWRPITQTLAPAGDGHGVVAGSTTAWLTP